MMTLENHSQAERKVEELEAQRCAIVNAHQIDSLAGLLTDDYVHVHAIGVIEDKETSVEGFRRTRRQMSRGELSVRVYGDMAIMIGEQDATLETENGPWAFQAIVTQVARQIDGAWRFVSFHACAIPSK